jgi:sugar lactone lactonase YvrE
LKRLTYLQALKYTLVIVLLLPCFLISCTKPNTDLIKNYNSGSTGSSGTTGGTGTTTDSTTTVFSSPDDVAVDAAGNIYVADYSDNLIRKISTTGIVTTLAGSGNIGAINGTGTAASFNGPSGLAVDAAGNVYVADSNNNLIRKITPAGLVSTFAGTIAAVDTSNTVSTEPVFSGPSGVAVDASGNIYVADAGNNRISIVNSAGVVNTFAGSGNAGADNGTGTAASFNNPTGVAVDAAGNVYVADFLNNLIRKISPARVVSTLAGNGNIGSSNGIDTAASFYFPNSLAVDAAGNVYVTDDINNLIRKVTPEGTVSTLAGSGKAGSANGTGVLASFNDPAGIAVDVAGNVYVADANNNLVREISPGGVVTTLAGSVPAIGVNHNTTLARFHVGTRLMIKRILKAKLR